LAKDWLTVANSRLQVQTPTCSLLISADGWANQLHDEIWVFSQGSWQKDHSLWKQIQIADWKDAILKDDFKKALQRDVNGFFSSKEIYKELAIHWKVCFLSLNSAFHRF